MTDGPLTGIRHIALSVIDLDRSAPWYEALFPLELAMDEDARSSMAEDIERGRVPEIDWLNGEIVALGDKTGVPTPVNLRLVELIESASRDGRSPAMSGGELLVATGLSG